MRAVLDTSVLVAAFRSQNGASNRVLRLALDLGFDTLATPALFLEYEEVLVRPDQLAAHRIPRGFVEEFLNGFGDIIEPISVYFHWRPQLLDPDDEMVLETALNGRAHVLITHNTRDFTPVSQFDLRILSPAEFLREVSK